MSYVFSDITGTDEGLIQECEDICNLGSAGISGNASRLKTFTRRLNGAKDRFHAIASKYDANWNFDDRNQTDLPIASTNIVSGQQDYQFASELLSVTQVFIKDSNGIFHQITEQDDKNDPESYLVSQANGLPTKYELVGNSILLTPKPNYASTNGLKVTFKRNGPKFASTDGAIPIGVPSLFFRYLANYASYPYLIEKGLKHAGAVLKSIGSHNPRDPFYGGDELAIAEFVSNRAKPKRSGLRVRQESNR